MLMYRIGTFSTLTKTTIKTLRYYDHTGLLKPEYVDPFNGYRYYTTRQLVDLSRVVSMRQAGLSIEGIQRVLAGGDARSIFQEHAVDLQQRLHDLTRQLEHLNSLLQTNKEALWMQYHATIRELPACIVYYKQGVVKQFADYGAFVLQSAQECRAANPNILCVEPDYCYISYLDPEYREQDVAIEYAQAVTERGVETETIRFKSLASVSAVCVYHQGAYQRLRDAYAFAMQFVEQNGYEQVESAREQYIDGAWNTQNEADYLTEIQIPVRRK